MNLWLYTLIGHESMDIWSVGRLPQWQNATAAIAAAVVAQIKPISNVRISIEEIQIIAFK